MNLSVEHVLLFLVAIFLLYHFLGNYGCREGFSDEQPQYFNWHFDTDHCHTDALIQEEFMMDCKKALSLHEGVDEINNYIYDLYKKYRKLQIESYNHNLFNKQLACNCEGSNLELSEDPNVCRLCDCRFNDTLKRDDGTEYREGTCSSWDGPPFDLSVDDAKIWKPPKMK
jgi:hypothetical protein